MPLDWLARSKEVSVPELIARGQHPKAIEALRAQLDERPEDSRIRLQLADVLVLAGRGYEAVPLFELLADEFARTGFAARAIAVLKRIQKLEPGRVDVAARLAAQIQEKIRHAPEPARGPRRPRPEEIGMIGVEEADRLPAVDLSAPLPPPAPEPEPQARPSSPPEPEVPAWAQEEPLPGSDLLLPAPARVAEPEPEVEVEPLVLQTPLFPDFSTEELLAVMGGLQLVVFEAGDIILSEGEPGDSLLILTTGVVKVYVRDPSGRHVLIRGMREGDFFGEISVLSGKARTATVTAATRSELLQLGRAALDDITATHPHVRDVLEDFYILRTNNEAEARIRRGS